MEVLRRKNGKTAEFLARKVPCSWGEKSRKRENKIPTPPRNLREIDEGVGKYYDRIYLANIINIFFYNGTNIVRACFDNVF